MVLLINQFVFAETELKKYIDATYGFSIEYPSNWDKREQAGRAAVAFISPLTDSNDDWPENCSVIVEKLNEKDAENYLKQNLFQIKNLTGYKEFSLKNTTNSLEIVYSAKGGIKNFKRAKVIQKLISDKNMGYVVTCGSTPKNFSSYEELFHKIINSLTLHN